MLIEFLISLILLIAPFFLLFLENLHIISSYTVTQYDVKFENLMSFGFVLFFIIVTTTLINQILKTTSLWRSSSPHRRLQEISSCLFICISLSCLIFIMILIATFPHYHSRKGPDVKKIAELKQIQIALINYSNDNG